MVVTFEVTPSSSASTSPYSSTATSASPPSAHDGDTTSASAEDNTFKFVANARICVSPNRGPLAGLTANTRGVS